MAFKGHITLDGNEYVLTQRPAKTFVNQMAPPVGQGESKYQDGTSWAAWVQRTWQEGNGRLDPVENGGFLYGEVESRVPSQLILPAALNISDTYEDLDSPPRFIPQSVAGTIMVTDDATYAYSATRVQRFGWKFTTPASLSTTRSSLFLYVLGRQPSPAAFATFKANSEVTTPSDSMRFGLYADDTNPPAIGVGVLDMASNWEQDVSNPGYVWYKFEFTFAPSISADLTPSTTYWVVLEGGLGSNNYFDLCYSSTTTGEGTAPTTVKSYNGTTWTTETDKYPVHFFDFGSLSPLGTAQKAGGGFFRLGEFLYCYTDEAIYRWDDTLWTYVDTFTVGSFTTGEGINMATTFGDTAWFGTSFGEYYTLDDTETGTVVAEPGSVFAAHQGLLYKAYNNIVEYTDDGITWEPTTSYPELGPIIVGPPHDYVTGMCGLGTDLYVSTTGGLYRITPGDFAIPVIPWGGYSNVNGTCMVNFEGALYITVGGRIIRFTEDGRGQDVWLTKEDDTLDSRVGRVMSLRAMNNWLIALVGPVPVTEGGVGAPTEGDPDGAYPSVWALQGNSWHLLSVLPADEEAEETTYSDYNLFYDRPTQRLWVMTPLAMPYYLYIPNATINPLNDPSYRFAPNAWVEWDWFDSNIYEVFKDYDEVAIIGENLSATCYVDVYWKDDDSAEEGPYSGYFGAWDYLNEWEYLGRANSNIGKIRWDIDRSDRPATTRFKLGLLFVTTDGTQSPRVRAIRVKYLPMLRDWYQWNLSFDVAGTAHSYQEGLNGEVNTRTANEISLELEAIARDPGIFLYTDIDGQQYEVKVKGGSMPYTKTELNEVSNEIEWEGEWTLTIEQANPDPYVAA